MSGFETNPKKLKDELLNIIHVREMALPDFQRDFVWQPKQTQDLIVSLSKDFPAGSLLRIESSNHMFAPRAFAGAPELDGHKPKYLVLDGQQRLSSLYQALYGTGDYLFFVNLAKLIEKQDIEEALLYDRKDRSEKRFGTIVAQAEKKVLPLSVIFGGQGFHSWLDEITELLEHDEKKRLSPKERKDLRDAYEKFIAPIVSYEFPVVTLTGNPSLEAVCTIFETLNNTGVRLSVFDLLSARYFPDGYNLRKMWLDAVENSDYLGDFEIDPYYILQMICSSVLNSVKRSDVLKLKAEVVSENWENAIWGMNSALEMLSDECGVLTPNWLSYNTILIPMATIFAQNRQLKGANVGVFRAKLKRWYWCSVFGQTYESNPTSQTITDITQIQTWLKGGNEPQSVKGFVFDNDLCRVSNKQRAVYRGLMCLVIRKPSLDFHSTKQISAALIKASSIDDHHIFPKGYLQETEPWMSELKGDKEIEIDSILNRTLIDRETNQRIGKNPPGAYLTDIENTIKEKSGDPTMLAKILESHNLPSDKNSSLWQNDFNQFRENRAKALGDLVLEAALHG